MTTTVPGTWTVLVDSPVLGRCEVSIAEGNVQPGQEVYLDYYIGRVTGVPEVVGLRLQPRVLSAQ